MRDRFAVRIRGAGVTGRSPLPVVASAQPLKFVERQPANVPDIFQFSFRRLRPSLVALLNEGCSCSQLVFCCLMGARKQKEEICGYEFFGNPAPSRTPIAVKMPRATLRSHLCQLAQQVRACQSGKSQSTQRASILETAEDAAYRSLRSEKNHSLSGDSDLHARSESEQLCVCGVRNVNATAASSGWNLAKPKSKHDFVICLTATASEQVKSKEKGFG